MSQHNHLKTLERRKTAETKPLELPKTSAREAQTSKSAWSLTKVKASSDTDDRVSS